MKAVPRIELCAGLKVKVEPLASYFQLQNGTFVLDDTSIVPQLSNEFYLGDSNFFEQREFLTSSIQFFINLGGKDSCKGDSGGPLYRWHENKVGSITSTSNFEEQFFLAR